MHSPEYANLPPKDGRLMIALPVEQKRRTHEAAVARGMTASEFVRRAIDAAVNDNGAPPQAA